MAKGRIGLDIGSTAVRAAELTGGDPPTVIKAAQVPLARRRRRERRGQATREVVTEALRELWERGGFKAKRVVHGRRQPTGRRARDRPALPAREGAEGLARVPGAGVHPDGRRRGRARLRPDRGIRAGRPQDVAHAAGRGTATDGRHRGVRSDRGQARAGRPRPRSLRDGSFGRHDRRRHGSRGRGRRGGHRHRRPRHQHRACTREAPFASSASSRPGGAT